MGRIKGRIVVPLVGAVAVVLGVGGCADDGGTSDETKAKISSAVTSTPEPDAAEALRSSIEATASSAMSGIGGAWDSAKAAAFVATFRTAYPNLSSDRDDESIEAIVTGTCPDIGSGASDEELKATVTELAANADTVPTEDHAARILQLVRPACP